MTDIVEKRQGFWSFVLLTGLMVLLGAAVMAAILVTAGCERKRARPLASGADGRAMLAAQAELWHVGLAEDHSRCDPEVCPVARAARERAPHAHAHGPTRSRRDPGPRNIAPADLTAEKAAAAAAIGPQPDLSAFGAPGKDAEGEQVLIVRSEYGGGTYYGRPDGHVRQTDYALAPLETTFQQRGLGEALHTVMDHAEHHHCAQDFVNRLWERGERLETTATFTLLLHAALSVDGKLRVDDVEVLDPEKRIDQATQACYVSAFRGLEADKLPDNVNMKAWHALPGGGKGLWFEWPACINPPRNK
ncbi:MAG TPA: hypothetical protein VMR48_02480 [Gaiellaceae bacterium]|nr:hypothetical protein [Gaiellaceae bacterium]